MSSVMKGALNKMTIKQAFDEVNATDEQKKNCLDRLLQSDKKRSFIPQIKRYAAAAAAVVVAAGTAGIGIHFAVTNNQGGPINVSIGGNSAADSVITPSENTRVHSEKSGMTFVDDKAFWAQLGKITYRRIDNTPTIDTTEINASDDFDSLFCTDKQVQSEMLDLFDNAIDITNKYIVLPDSNAAVGISSDMSVQEIESFKNNSANCFVGTGYYENERFYYADKAYFGFDTSEEFINTVSQVYTGNYSDNFTEDFYDYCPDYIQPADKNNIKSNFGINIGKELPITEPYSAHTQYCAAVYTDESHNSLILLSLTAKEGNNDSKTFELKYIPMKYVDGKLRIVVEIYNTIFMDVNAYSDNFMYNCGMASEIESDAKTIDITSVVGDSDNSSRPEETKAVTTVKATTSTTAPATSTTPQTTATMTVTTKTTAATTAKPAPEPTGTATNVTLRMTGDESYLQRGYLYYLKVSNEFINNSDVLEYASDKMSEYPMFNTDGSDHTFDSIECGTYIIAGPWICATSDSGYATFRVTESNSNGIINIDLNNGTVAKDKIKVVEPVREEEPLPESDKLAMVFDDSIIFENEKYRICGSEDTYFKADGNYLKDIASDDRKFRKIYYLPDSGTRVNICGKELTREEIKQNVLLCKHHPLGGKSDYYRIYVKESFCRYIKKATGAKSVTAHAANTNYNDLAEVRILGENTKFGVKDKNGKPIANESFAVYYLDSVDRYFLKNNTPLTSRFAAYDPAYGDDCFNTDKNGMIPTWTEDPSGDGVLVQHGFLLYSGSAVIIKESDISDNRIGDNYAVCVYNISDDGITFEASYPYSMFRDRIWADNSYHNNKGY